MFNPYDVLVAQPDIRYTVALMPDEVKGAYICRNDRHTIVINKCLNQVERRCTLTHELAHYFLGHTGDYFSLNNAYSVVSHSKKEHDAWVWASDRLIDTQQYIDFVRRDHQLTIADICDTFRVTEQILTFKAKHLVEIGNLEGYFFMPDIM
jgi:Zn-dependent peptidase ImmA (M78 family)